MVRPFYEGERTNSIWLVLIPKTSRSNRICSCFFVKRTNQIFYVRSFSEKNEQIKICSFFFIFQKILIHHFHVIYKRDKIFEKSFGSFFEFFNKKNYSVNFFPFFLLNEQRIFLFVLLKLSPLLCFICICINRSLALLSWYVRGVLRRKKEID